MADLVLWVKMRLGITGAVDPLTKSRRVRRCCGESPRRVGSARLQKKERSKVGMREGKTARGCEGAGEGGV